MDIRVELEPDAEQKILERVDVVFTDDLGPQVLVAAKQKCPVDTGALRDSIHVYVDDEHRLILEATEDYAIYVEEGTRPHIIRSKGDYPLRNRKTGQVFGPVVHHPGTHPQPFLRPAVYIDHNLLRKLLGG